MSLLEQDTIKKKQIDENVTELDVGDNDSKKYKVEAIWDNTVYARGSKSGQLPDLYNLVL